MEIHYANKKLEKQMTDASTMRKVYGELAIKLSQRIDEMESMPNLEEFKKLPGPKCHQLKGNRSSEWAAKLSGNWRLIFELAHNPIPKNIDGSIDAAKVNTVELTAVEDYH